MSAIKDPIETLKDLYKWLIVPTTFLIWIAWNYLNHLSVTILAHPELSPYSTPINPTELMEESYLASLELLLFVPSVIVFVVTAGMRPGRAWVGCMVFSYWGLFFTLILIGMTFVEEWVLLNLAYVGYWGIVLVLSLLLSVLVVWQTYSEQKRLSARK